MSEQPSIHGTGGVQTMTGGSAAARHPRREEATPTTAARDFHSMEETIRLVCPECDAIHRVKQITLGKLYRCKKCKAGLITMSPAMLACPSCDARTPPAHVEVSRLITCDRCEDSPLMQVEFQPVPRPVREVRTVAEPAEADVRADLVAEDVSHHNVNATPDAGSDSSPDAEDEELERIARALAGEDAGIDDALGIDTVGDESDDLPDVLAAPVEDTLSDTTARVQTADRDDRNHTSDTRDPFTTQNASTARPTPETAPASNPSTSTAPDNTADDSQTPFGGTSHGRDHAAHPTHHPDVEVPERSAPFHKPAAPRINPSPASPGADTHTHTGTNSNASAAPLQVPALANAGQNDRAVAALKSVLDDLQKPLLAEIERARWSISLWIPLLAMLPLAALIGWLFSELGEANDMKKRLIQLQESQQKDQEMMTQDFEKLYRELQLLRRENESLRQENDALNRRNARTP